MAIQEIRFVQTIANQLDPFTFNPNLSSQDFTVYALNANPKAITNQFEIGTNNPVEQVIRFTPVAYALRSLRAFINVLSIEAVQPVVIELEDSQQTIINKNNENDSKYPYYWLYFDIKQGARRATVGQFKLQNKRPGYYINLLPFLGNNADFLGDSSTEIIISIQDSGWGLPGADDVISFYGEVETIGYIADLQQSQNTINTVLSGQLTVNSGTNNNTVTNQFKINILGSIPDVVKVYYLPINATFDNPIDLAVYEYIELPYNQELDFTEFLVSKGQGHYVIAPIAFNVFDTFWNVPGIQATFNPTDAGTLTYGYFLDSAMLKNTAIDLFVVKVLTLPVSIQVNWQ